MMGALGTWSIAVGALLRATLDGQWAGIDLPVLGVMLVAIGAIVLVADMVRMRARTGALIA